MFHKKLSRKCKTTLGCSMCWEDLTVNGDGRPSLQRGLGELPGGGTEGKCQGRRRGEVDLAAAGVWATASQQESAEPEQACVWRRKPGSGMSSPCLFQQISTFGFIFWEEIVIISIEETVIAYFPKSLSWETSQVLLEPPKVSRSWQCAQQDVAAMVMEITDVLQIL